MELDRLQTFRDVARCGSLAAAARLAGCDASIVSRSIAALEAELGVRLFQRTTRRLQLTEAGEVYLKRIEPVLDELTTARDEALGLVGQPQGRLRLTASSAFGQTVIAPLLPAFRRAYPEVELELILTDALVDLIAERVDLALRLGPRPSGDWIVSRLMPTPMRAVASPDYLSTAPPLAVPGDIGGHACLIPAAQSRATWIFRRDGVEEAISVGGAIATSNTLVLKRCALDGLGIAVLADWLVHDDLASCRLQGVLPEWEVAARHFDTGVWIVYPSRHFLPLKTRVFIDHLKAHVRRPNITPEVVETRSPNRHS